MPKTQNRTVMLWLFIFAFIVAFLVVFGGFVRLTRSGLSIVEWNPISGVVPPIGAQAWQEEFAKYQLTPEFQKINTIMTLEEYKFIFYMEWVHRLIARLAGLAFAIPVFYFFFKRQIPKGERGIYVVMGLLFIGQAFMGWFMVASGLVDRPAVSHFRLTIHLLFALSLFALALWTAIGHKFGFPDYARKTQWSSVSKWTLAGTVILLVQIAYGGLTAGLKAGHVSDTWPLMLGKLVPPNLFDSAAKFLENPQTIVFVHRWFAFTGLVIVPLVYVIARKKGLPRDLLNGFAVTLGLTILQITLGILTVLLHVDITIALLHQANAIALFGAALYMLHRLRARDRQNARQT
jgi:cytochrome c oxidase assembly protein subunit 15